ncbi:hypothetical protein OBBRIDRAFT_808506 [Obba rivulosa]|uniref:Uncharacterized protein n=1 Tax=Obba rivulosa TaxID=1052685 RepID=A0A8E2ANY1_9APHY|nr:hypothetical protein OBBRIDRAFT_808506 [Obba rivulosa]
MLPLQIALYALAAYFGAFGSNLAPVRTLELSLQILGDVISAELLTIRSDVDYFIGSVDIRTFLAPLVPSSVEDFVTYTLQPAFDQTLDASALQWTNTRIAIAGLVHPGRCSCECGMVSVVDVITAFYGSQDVLPDMTTSEPGEPIQYVLPLLEPVPAYVLGMESFKWPGTQCFLDVADSPREISGLLVPPSTPPPTSTHFFGYSSYTRKRRTLAYPAKPIDLRGLALAWYTYCFGLLSDFLERRHLGLPVGMPPFILCMFLGFIIGKGIKSLSRMVLQGGVEVVEVGPDTILVPQALVVHDVAITLADIDIQKHAVSVPPARTSTPRIQHRRTVSESAEPQSLPQEMVCLLGTWSLPGSPNPGSLAYSDDIHEDFALSSLIPMDCDGVPVQLSPPAELSQSMMLSCPEPSGSPTLSPMFSSSFLASPASPSAAAICVKLHLSNISDPSSTPVNEAPVSHPSTTPLDFDSTLAHSSPSRTPPESMSSPVDSWSSSMASPVLSSPAIIWDMHDHYDILGLLSMPVDDTAVFHPSMSPIDFGDAPAQSSPPRTPARSMPPSVPLWSSPLAASKSARPVTTQATHRDASVADLPPIPVDEAPVFDLPTTPIDFDDAPAQSSPPRSMSPSVASSSSRLAAPESSNTVTASAAHHSAGIPGLPSTLVNQRPATRPPANAEAESRQQPEAPLSGRRQLARGGGFRLLAHAMNDALVSRTAPIEARSVDDQGLPR